MLRSILHGVVLRKISLQHYFAWDFSAASAPCHLSKQLKRTLGGAEIRKPESHVGSHHADQSYAVNVMTFGDHLCAHEQIQFACVQRVQHTFEIGMAADSVAIETR